LPWFPAGHRKARGSIRRPRGPATRSPPRRPASRCDAFPDR
jgi:hypothetical protein